MSDVMAAEFPREECVKSGCFLDGVSHFYFCHLLCCIRGNTSVTLKLFVAEALWWSGAPKYLSKILTHKAALPAFLNDAQGHTSSL